MATIQDVAKAARVSVGTVSRAMNDYADVSAATKDKIFKAAKELGYWPNLNARSLSSKKQINIALILSGFLEEKMFNDFETMLMKGSYSYALEHGIEISMHVINTQIQSEKSYDQLCHEYGISGAIFFGLKTTDPYFETLPQSEKPCVTVDFELKGPNIGNVAVDNLKAFQELTQYLIDCNHRKIVLMHGRKNAMVSMERLVGAYEAMRAESMRITPKGCLSRSAAGIRKRTLIINLPGSKKASAENILAVIDPVEHGLDMLYSEGSADCGK